MDQIKSKLSKIKQKAIITNDRIEHPLTIEHPSTFSAINKTGEGEIMNSSELSVPTTLKSFITNLSINIIDYSDPNDYHTIYQNTSVIADEVLAHRLGLIPIKANPSLFQEKIKDDEYNETNSLKFKLNIKCTSNHDFEDPTEISNEHGSIHAKQLFNNSSVYSSDLEWVPIGNQKSTFKSIRPVFEDILIAKLRPGQEIELEAICEKGIGQTHAKWSPVSTAYYRLLPSITIKQKITDQDAQELKTTCPLGVFDIENSGKHTQSVVANERKCTVCRECIRNPKFTDLIELAKIKDHYEFHIESVGIMSPDVLLKEALQILENKATFWLESINNLE